MRSRSTTIIGAGIAVAILGAVLVFAYARNLQGTAGATGGSNVTAYVATAPIAVGTKGSALSTSVRATSVPASAKPADALTSLTQVSSQQALRSIEAGEVISASQFGAAGTPNTATTGLTIPAGFDAITITSPVQQAVAGYISPGDQVNVFAAVKDAQAVKMILSNVTVLGTVPASAAAAAKAGAQTTAAAASADVYLTLALTPAQEEKLVYAGSYAGLWFGLVHPGNGPATTAGVNHANFLQ